MDKLKVDEKWIIGLFDPFLSAHNTITLNVILDSKEIITLKPN